MELYAVLAYIALAFFLGLALMHVIHTQGFSNAKAEVNKIENVVIPTLRGNAATDVMKENINRLARLRDEAAQKTNDANNLATLINAEKAQIAALQVV